MKEILFLATCLLAGCRPAIKPQPLLIAVEEAQGRYTFNDSKGTNSDRFILYAYHDKLAIDIFAYYVPVALIRHFPDSTLVYFPIAGQLGLLGPDDLLPIEDWKVPITPLAAAYHGLIPENPDSVTKIADTLFAWKASTAYLQVADNSRLIALRGAGWSLERSGELLRMPERSRMIVFKKEDSELTLDFTSLAFRELDTAKVFALDVPGALRIDYRKKPPPE